MKLTQKKLNAMLENPNDQRTYKYSGGLPIQFQGPFSLMFEPSLAQPTREHPFPRRVSRPTLYNPDTTPQSVRHLPFHQPRSSQPRPCRFAVSQVQLYILHTCTLLSLPPFPSHTGIHSPGNTHINSHHAQQARYEDRAPARWARRRLAALSAQERGKVRRRLRL